MKPDAYYAKLERLGTDKEPTLDRELLETHIREFFASGGKIEVLPGVGDGVMGRAETGELE